MAKALCTARRSRELAAATKETVMWGDVESAEIIVPFAFLKLSSSCRLATWQLRLLAKWLLLGWVIKSNGIDGPGFFESVQESPNRNHRYAAFGPRPQNTSPCGASHPEACWRRGGGGGGGNWGRGRGRADDG